MEATLNKSLNLVVPLYPYSDDDKPTFAKRQEVTPYAYVHSMPIMYETFEMYCEPLGSAYNSIIASEIGHAAPMISKQLIVKAAQRMGLYENNERIVPKYWGIEDGLFAEMYRLTSVITKNKEGVWITTQWDAGGKDLLLPEDRRDVENAISFFTVGVHLYPRRERKGFLTSGLSLWGGRVESLNSTAFAASLRTSTPAATTEKTAKTASDVTSETSTKEMIFPPDPVTQQAERILRALS